MSFTIVNKSVNRLDVLEKVTGQVKYCADLNFGGQLYAKTLYTKFPRAEILSIDTSDAEKMEGVAAVITAKDVPGNNYMFGRFPVLADREAKYIGDGIAVVAAESAPQAEKALRKIKVEYRELPGLFTIEDAIAPGADRVHSDLKDNIVENSNHRMYMGDVEKGFKEADVILERKYATQFVDQAYIEPEVVIVFPDPYRAGVEIHGSIQNIYSIRQNVATVLGFKISQVRVIQGTIGGSFGGKDESILMMAGRCAVLAMKLDRPVKMVLTREESLLESCKRHAYRAEYKIGFKKDGTITAVEDKIYVQAGPYNNKAQFTNWRGSVHAAGAYFVPHVKTDFYGVYTHTIYGGAYRGFSAPQVLFCNESLMDEAALELGMDPADLRLKNCLKGGDEIATGQILEPGKFPTNLKEMIEDVLQRSGYRNKRKEYSEANKTSRDIKKGIGLAITYRGTGLGGEGIDTAGATVTIDKDGSVSIQSGMIEMGQGIRTSHAQVVAEVLGISLGRLTFSTSDTSIVMDGGPTVASRGLLAGGRAMLLAAETLKARLAEAAAKKWGVDPASVVIGNDMVKSDEGSGFSMSFDELVNYSLYGLGLSLSAQGWYNPGPEHLDHETGRGNAYPSYIYGVTATEITADLGTGKIHVDKMTLAYEIGCAVNPQIVEGQLLGGLLQGVGYAIMEDMEHSKGYLRTRNFDEYMIPVSTDTPEFDLKLFETDKNVGPFGAKGVGEIGIELAAPSIANALFHATGKRIRELPLNLERVLLGKDLKR